MRAALVGATVCLLALVLIPFVILALPVPDIPGGWCQSGGRPGHYMVEDVAKGLLLADGLAAIGLVISMASTRRILVTIGALLFGAAAFYFAYIVYGGSIDCAFY